MTTMTVRSNKELGYNPALFVNQSGIQDVLCGLCGRVAKKPMEITCINTETNERKQHDDVIFCLNCLAHSFDVSECPVCKNTLYQENTVSNKRAEKSIWKLKIYCSYKRHGCNWQGQLQTIKNHLLVCPIKKSMKPHINLSSSQSNQQFTKHLSTHSYTHKNTTSLKFGSPQPSNHSPVYTLSPKPPHNGYGSKYSHHQQHQQQQQQQQQQQLQQPLITPQSNPTPMIPQQSNEDTQDIKSNGSGVIENRLSIIYESEFNDKITFLHNKIKKLTETVENLNDKMDTTNTRINNISKRLHEFDRRVSDLEIKSSINITDEEIINDTTKNTINGNYPNNNKQQSQLQSQSESQLHNSTHIDPQHKQQSSSFNYSMHNGVYTNQPI